MGGIHGILGDREKLVMRREGTILLLLLLNACVHVADVMIFTFVSLMPVHNVCRICMIIK